MILRISQPLYNQVSEIAENEYRSVNGQIEYIIRDYVHRLQEEERGVIKVKNERDARLIKCSAQNMSGRPKTAQIMTQILKRTCFSKSQRLLFRLPPL